MTFNRTSGTFNAAACPINTFGSIELTYGLKFSPCKPCPRGLVTRAAASISKDNCTNNPGWGWNGFTAEICPPGSYAANNTLMSCTTCPLNRNTTSIATGANAPFFTDAVSAMPLPAGAGTDMDSVEDCKVIAGFGVINSTGIMDLADAAVHSTPWTLDVGECPIGTYGTGGATGAVCVTCASLLLSGAGAGPYSTTLESGSTNLTDCNGKLAFSSLPT